MDLRSPHEQPVELPDPLQPDEPGRGGRLRLTGAELGATAVEYALLVAFVAAVIIATVATLGVTTADTFVVPCLNGPTCP